MSWASSGPSSGAAECLPSSPRRRRNGEAFWSLVKTNVRNAQNLKVAPKIVPSTLAEMLSASALSWSSTLREIHSNEIGMTKDAKLIAA
ncbi:MAG: hypothetical protein JWR35_2891 [Marmoricola sp.]|nr:hypothetical protein [Marmoricola sp.]